MFSPRRTFVAHLAINRHLLLSPSLSCPLANWAATLAWAWPVSNWILMRRAAARTQRRCLMGLFQIRDWAWERSKTFACWRMPWRALTGHASLLYPLDWHSFQILLDHARQNCLQRQRSNGSYSLAPLFRLFIILILAFSVTDFAYYCCTVETVCYLLLPVIIAITLNLANRCCHSLNN